MNFRKYKHVLGFTLTEMMIAVAIIGILAVIATMSFLTQQHKGNDSKRKADLDRIKIAVEEYEKDHNCYPPASAMSMCGSSTSIAIHPYLSDVPCDPTTGEPYKYEAESSTCADWFRLFSLLQYTKDPEAIPNIGPEGEANYNYYVSSGSAPAPVSDTSSPLLPPPGCAPADRRWGCIDGKCVEIQLDEFCNPVCDPGYTSSDCFGQCTNPAAECIPY